LLRQGEAPRQIDPSEFPVSIIPTGLSAEGKRKQMALEIDRYEFLALLGGFVDYPNGL
jgi:hypothetical protein